MKTARQLFLSLVLFPIKHPTWWKTFRSFVTSLPAATMGFLAWRMTAGHEESPFALAQKSVKTAIEEHVAWIVSLLFLPTLLSILADAWEGWAKRVYERQQGDLPAIVQTTLIRALDEIVAKKLHRFASFLKKYLRSKIRAIDIFSEITQPEIQIDEILAQMYNAFSLLLDSKSLKIVLVECKDNKPLNYIAFKPSDARPEETLLSEEAFFHSVAQSERPIAIPNIADHCQSLKRRKASRNAPKFLQIGDSAAEGSIVGYPVRNTYVNEKTFVLSLTCSEIDVFDDQFIKKYRTIMDAFLKRILMEGCLMRIKNHTAQIDGQNDLSP